MRYIIGLIGILLTLMVIPGVLAQGADNTGMYLQSEGSGGFINDNEGNIYHEQTENQGWIGNGKDFNNNQNLDQIIRILKEHGIDTSQLEIAIKSGNMAIVQSLLSRYQNLINEGMIRYRARTRTIRTAHRARTRTIRTRHRARTRIIRTRYRTRTRIIRTRYRTRTRIIRTRYRTRTRIIRTRHRARTRIMRTRYRTRTRTIRTRYRARIRTIKNLLQ